MAAPYISRPDLERQLVDVRKRPESARPRLLAFFLFDERSSHRSVQRFVDTEGNWLDSLARSSNIMIFFFRKANRRNTIKGDAVLSDDVITVEGKFKNPGLELAAEFGIGPDHLPGIVFFRADQFMLESPLEFNSPKGLYWQIPAESFQADRSIIEREIAHLFTLVQEARNRSHNADGMLMELTASLAAMRRADADQSFLHLLGKGIKLVVTYPGKLIEAAVIAFGTAVGTTLATKTLS